MVVKHALGHQGVQTPRVLLDLCILAFQPQNKNLNLLHQGRELLLQLNTVTFRRVRTMYVILLTKTKS